MATVLNKQPAEDKLFDFDFSGKMRDGDSITSVGSVTQEKLGLVSNSADLTLGSTAQSGQTGQVRISGGTDGEQYKIEMVVTTTDGDTLEGEGILTVRDK